MQVIDSLFSTVAKSSSVADTSTWILEFDDIILQVFNGGVFAEVDDMYCKKFGIFD
jgi:hypothetical protein